MPRSRILQDILTQTVAQTLFPAQPALPFSDNNPRCKRGEGTTVKQAGGRRFRGYTMRGEMSGEAQNSWRKPHPAPSQRSNAAAALPKTQAALGPDRLRS